MDTFGGMVRSARRSKGLTLVQVGKRVGITKGYLSGVECGMVAPPAERVVRKLARCLGVDVVEAMKAAWLTKVPRELRPFLEVKDASQDQPVADTPLTEEQAVQGFKQVFAPDGSAQPPAGHTPSDPNTGTYGPVSLRLDEMPVRPVGGDGA